MSSKRKLQRNGLDEGLIEEINSLKFLNNNLIEKHSKTTKRIFDLEEEIERLEDRNEELETSILKLKKKVRLPLTFDEKDALQRMYLLYSHYLDNLEEDEIGIVTKEDIEKRKSDFCSAIKKLRIHKICISNTWRRANDNK